MIATLALGAVPAFARVAVVTSGVATSTKRAAFGANATENVRSAADKQIATRIDSLDKLSTRVQAMAHLSSAEKSTIAASISSEIASLKALQAKIDADATTTLKADVQSITKGERVYLLVEPQIRILAAADRAASIGNMLSAFADKITARLALVLNTAASSLLADLRTKISDAQTQSAAVISETASLQPDNGDAAIKASNAAALKNARSKIKAAQSDLKAAYKDATQIVKLLKKGVKPATASTTATTTPTPQ